MHSICEGQKKDETQVNQTNLRKKNYYGTMALFTNPLSFRNMSNNHLKCSQQSFRGPVYYLSSVLHFTPDWVWVQGCWPARVVPGSRFVGSDHAGGGKGHQRRQQRHRSHRLDLLHHRRSWKRIAQDGQTAVGRGHGQARIVAGIAVRT